MGMLNFLFILSEFKIKSLVIGKFDGLYLGY